MTKPTTQILLALIGLVFTAAACFPDFEQSCDPDFNEDCTCSDSFDRACEKGDVDCECTQPERERREDNNPDPNPTPSPSPDVFVNPLDIARAFGDINGGDVVSELRPDQRESICGELKSYTLNEVRDDEFADLMCTITGIFQAGLSTPEGQDQTPACQEARAECLEAGLDAEQADRNVCDGLSDACAATVDELSVCFTQSVTALAEVAVATSCETGFDAAGLSANTSGCDVVRQKCPEIFK